MNQEGLEGAQVSVQEEPSPLDGEAITPRAGLETASSAKCFQHKDLSSSPETHVTEHGCGSAHICNPSTGRRRLLDPWDQLASQSECASESLSQRKGQWCKVPAPQQASPWSNSPNQTKSNRTRKNPGLTDTNAPRGFSTLQRGARKGRPDNHVLALWGTI